MPEPATIRAPRSKPHRPNQGWSGSPQGGHQTAALLILNLGDRVNLLRNDGGNRENWLVVNPIGTVSNRNAGHTVSNRSLTPCAQDARRSPHVACAPV